MLVKVKNPDSRQLILIKENLWQSIISDVITFGFLLLCLWVSLLVDRLLWQLVFVGMGLVSIFAKIGVKAASPTVKCFSSIEEAKTWLESQS